MALTEAAASGADAEQALGRLSGGWAALALEEKPDVGLTDPGLLALLAQRMSTALARQEALAREEAAADALAAQVTQARTDLDGLRASQADAQVALQTAQGALARVRADTDTLRERHRAVVAELERLAGSLAPALEPLADWRARLERSPAGGARAVPDLGRSVGAPHAR